MKEKKNKCREHFSMFANDTTDNECTEEKVCVYKRIKNSFS